MTEDRRRRLETLLAADTDEDAQASSSRMSLICARCVSELSVAGAGATVLSYPDNGDSNDGGPHRGLVYATNDVSSGLEDLQLTVGEGPCLDTFSTGGPVLIANLAYETDRWPGFTPGARALGAVAVFSFPLQVGVIRLGSLDLYRDTTGSLSGAQMTDALVLADLATQAVLHELDGHPTQDLGWLADPHTEIYQASGMLQVQLGTTTDAALMRLRAHAYLNEIPLAEVAGQVVRRELRFTPEQ